MKRKIIVSVLIVLMIAVCMSVIGCGHAHNYVDGTCTVCGSKQPTEGLEYTKIEDKEEYAVTGIGDATDNDIVIAEEYEGLPVTSIGDKAFMGRSELTSITIPDSIRSIGDAAFAYCSLTSVTIPDSVTSIGSGAFDGCSSLLSINVRENNQQYKSIDGNLYSKDGKTLVQYAIGKESSFFEIPDSVTSIGSCAFSSCKGIVSIKIPDNVKSIGYAAFGLCSSLTSVTIPDSVTSIGDWTFSGCSSLTSITIPDSVTSIGDYAFDNCVSLANVKIPDSVKSIGYWVFRDCIGLTNMIIGNSVTSIGVGAFSGCKGLANITIPDGVMSIEDSAFLNCSDLTSIAIPNSVTSISETAFSYCSSLTSIVVSGGNNVYHSAGNCLIETESKTIIAGCKNSVIPSDGSVTSIGDSAFYKCKGLTDITIPNSITSIDDYVFYECEELTSVYYKGTAEEWKAISIGKYNDSLETVTIYYYSETEPTADGNYWHYDENGNIVVWGKK